MEEKKESAIPSEKILQNEIRDLLKDLNPADFNKVTFMDIIIQLEKKFNVDLRVIQSHVKLLIRREVGRLVPKGSKMMRTKMETEREGAAGEIEAKAEAKVEPGEAPEAEAGDTRGSKESRDA